jgi:hypothetical protein
MEDEEITNGAWRSIDGRFWETPERRYMTAGEQTRHTDILRGLTAGLQLLLGLAKTGSPAHTFLAVRAVRRRLNVLETEAVALARSYGWSWGHIAYALGTTRSAAHKRFARPGTFKLPGASRASTPGSPGARTPPGFPET